MTSNPWFITYRKNPTKKINLFCFHHSGGGASTFYPWLDHLSPSIEMIAIQLAGRETRFTEKHINKLDEILENLSKGFNAVKETPFFLLGHSLGGLLAYEFAKKVYENYSISPKHLIISARKAPHMPNRMQGLSTLSDESLKEKLKLYDGVDDKILHNEELLDIFLPIIRSDFSISEMYNNPKIFPLPCNITHLSGKDDQTINQQEIMEWGKYTTRNFKSLTFNGGHFFIKNNQNDIIRYINDIVASEFSIF